MTTTTITTTAVRRQTAPPDRPIHLQMSPAQWAAVLDNPRQRNTEQHLARAKHLLTHSATHAHVFMAITRDGQRVKLDGHTRSLLWTRTPKLAPKTIYVTCFYVSDLDEAAQLYTHFDNQAATENAKDRMFGAFRAVGYMPESGLFREGRATTAFQTAESIVRTGTFANITAARNAPGTSIYEILPLWLDEVKLLDSINPDHRKFPSVILTAALLTLGRRPNDRAKTLEFWSLYNNDKGIKLEHDYDGVEALTRLVTKARAEGNLTKNWRLLGRAISAYETWRTRRTYKSNSAPKETDVSAYMGIEIAKLANARC
jgi:hypothetical protein